jgi:hypothetical protein
MSVRAVIKHMEHSIYLDPNARRDIEDLECTDCDWTTEGEGRSLSFQQLLDLAMKHTGSTGHSGFQQTTTNFWRVVREDQDTATQLSVPVALPLPRVCEPGKPQL